MDTGSYRPVNVQVDQMTSEPHTGKNPEGKSSSPSTFIIEMDLKCICFYFRDYRPLLGFFLQFYSLIGQLCIAYGLKVQPWSIW